METQKPTFDFDTKSVDNWTTQYVETVKLYSNVPYKQAKSLYNELLKTEQFRYKDESCYAKFKPVACIVYYSVFGWTGQWVAKFYSDVKDYEKELDVIFTDEPSGKYGKKRLTFICK